MREMPKIRLMTAEELKTAMPRIRAQKGDISRTIEEFMESGKPAIAIDAKHKNWRCAYSAIHYGIERMGLKNVIGLTSRDGKIYMIRLDMETMEIKYDLEPRVKKPMRANVIGPNMTRVREFLASGAPAAEVEYTQSCAANARKAFLESILACGLEEKVRTISKGGRLYLIRISD